MTRRPVPPPEVLQLIRRSPGRVASTRQIGRLGPDRHAVAEWVRAGTLERLAPAWVRLPGDDAPHQAGHLAVGYLQHHRPGEPVVLTRRYALSTVVPDMPRPAVPTVLVAAGRRVRVRREPWEVLQREGVDAVPVLTHHGLPVAEPAYALADEAADPRTTEDDLIATIYRVVNATRIPAVALVAAWSRMRHPGASRLLDLTARGVMEHESPAELRLFRDVFAGHPPLPDCQVLLTPSIRVDFAYIFAALIVEYYGEDSHAGRVDEDGSRLFAVRDLGMESIIVTKSVARDPVGLRHHIHRTRREREDLMLRGLLRRPSLPRQPDRLTPLRTLLPGG